jgi:gluconolactonase
LTSRPRARGKRAIHTSRRSFLATLGTLAAAPLLSKSDARDFGKHAEPVCYPEPDVIALEDAFKKIKIGNAPIERLHTGMGWVVAHRGWEESD